MHRLLGLFAILLWGGLFAQPVELRLQLTNASTGEALPNGFVKLGKQWQVTNVNGVGIFKLPAGEYALSAGYTGFHDTTFTINLRNDTSIIVNLRERSVLLTEVEVRDNRLSGAEAVLKNQVMRSSITQVDVRAQPMIGGEPDLLKPLQNLPGVQAGLPGSADVYVRGGDQYQNSIMLDGFPIYNISHGMGYASAIPVAGVERLDFYKQAFPVEYGNATASFTDVTLQRADTRKWSGELGGGIGSFRGQINVPLKEGVSGLQLGGRFSTIGMAMELLEVFNVRFEGLFGFSDMTGKYHHRLGDRDVLEVIGYYSSDRIRSRDEFSGSHTSINTGNLLAGITHYHSNKDHSLLTQKVHFSNYFFNQDKEYRQNRYGDGFEAGDRLFYDFGVNNFGYEGSWQKQLSTSFQLKAGVEFNAHLFNMPAAEMEAEDAPHDYPETEGSVRPVYNPVVFAGSQWNVSDAITLNLGARISAFSYDGQGLKVKPLPRVSLEYSPLRNWAFFTSYDQTVQAYHRFRNTFFGSPMDFPLPATERLPVQESEQTAVGVVYTLGNLNIQAQAYYRNMTNAVDRDYSQPTLVYDTEGEQTPDTDPLSGLVSVDGTAYGLETAFGYKWNILNFYGAYTWSRSFRQNPMLNRGERYPFEYNREHQFNIGGKVRFKRNSINKITEIGLSYTYGTCNFTQFPVQHRAMPESNDLYDRFNLDNTFVGSRNNAQLPVAQHLDVVFNFIAKKKKGVRIFSISAFNLLFSPLVTNYVMESDEIKGEGPISFVPAITYTYKF